MYYRTEVSAGHLCTEGLPFASRFLEKQTPSLPNIGLAFGSFPKHSVDPKANLAPAPLIPADYQCTSTQDCMYIQRYSVHTPYIAR